MARLALLLFPWATAVVRASATAPTSIGFFTGNGTSSNLTAFRTTLNAAAAAAFDAYVIVELGDADVARVAPGDFAALVFPGGSGNGQAAAIGAAGLAAVRAFVGGGGGYVGTCGGAFLGLQHAKFYGDGPAAAGPPTQEPWDRGSGDVLMEVGRS